MDWVVEVPAEVSPVTTVRLAEEALGGGAPLIIAPSHGAEPPAGMAANGHSLGVAGLNLLRAQSRLGRLEHPLVHFCPGRPGEGTRSPPAAGGALPQRGTVLRSHGR